MSHSTKGELKATVPLREVHLSTIEKARRHRRRGRLNMVAPASWVRRIDEWRRQQPDLPNISEAIRRLVEAGLEATTKKTTHSRRK